MLAFHEKPELKQFYIDRAIKHREADEIVQGFGYWKNGKGCAIGCLAHADSGAHFKLQKDAGLPRTLNRIADGIFEGLPKAESVLWPQQYIEACLVGADLSGVSDRFLHWLLVDPEDGVIKYARSENSKAKIKTVGDMYARKIEGEKISPADWRAAAAAAAADAADAYAAAAAAYAAAADADADAAAAAAADADAAAAYAADDAAAAAAAYAAAAAAAADAADAAYDADAAAAYAADAAAADAYAAAAAADAYAAARQKARIKQASKLLELIKEAPIPNNLAA